MSQLSREWIFWSAVAACAVAEAAIIFSSIKSLRRAKGKNAVSETVWAVLPAIGLAWLLVATWCELARSGAHEHMSMPMQMPASHS
jgi:heme/copper-type cytochrome/quinol oxidase subunit 2